MTDEIHALLLRQIPHVERDYPAVQRGNGLRIATTFGFYTQAKSVVEVIQAVKAACDAQIPYVVLGANTATLFLGEYFAGLVIQNFAKSTTFIAAKSQVVVDAGVFLPELIVAAASRGLGGLTPLYGLKGTIGAALAHDPDYDGQRLSSSLNALTLLLPPTKMKPEPRIVHYSGAWLTTVKGNDRTKIAELQRLHGLPLSPVVLTAHIQLTHNRHDEIARRLQVVVQQAQRGQPKGTEWFGPLFLPLQETTLQEVLQRAGCHKISHQGLFLDRHHSNYLRAKRSTPRDAFGRIAPELVMEFVELIRKQVHTMTTRDLELAFSVVQ